MKLQEVKDKYADSRGYVDWEDYYVNNLDESVEALVGEIAKLYAKAKLEEAAEELHLKANQYDFLRSMDAKSKSEAMREAAESITKTPLD